MMRIEISRARRGKPPAAGFAISHVLHRLLLYISCKLSSIPVAVRRPDTSFIVVCCALWMGMSSSVPTLVNISIVIWPSRSRSVRPEVSITLTAVLFLPAARIKVSFALLTLRVTRSTWVIIIIRLGGTCLWIVLRMVIFACMIAAFPIPMIGRARAARPVPFTDYNVVTLLLSLEYLLIHYLRSLLSLRGDCFETSFWRLDRDCTYSEFSVARSSLRGSTCLILAARWSVGFLLRFISCGSSCRESKGCILAEESHATLGSSPNSPLYLFFFSLLSPYLFVRVTASVSIIFFVQINFFYILVSSICSVEPWRERERKDFQASPCTDRYIHRKKIHG